jgi:acyl dehydratase
MPIFSAAAGSLLDTHRERISVRRILAYAAGIGATASPAFDDDRAGGVVAMPPFCVSLEWPVVSGARARDCLRAEGAEQWRGVHAGQDSFFHRPIRPDDDLQTTGTIAAVRPTRAGALVSMKLETTDAVTGEPVVTSWSSSLYRGVEVAGAAAVTETAPAVAEPEVGSPGDERPPAGAVAIPIAREMPHVYTECASIWNPIHTERAVALAAGLPDIILHGTATWALAGREIVRLYCDGDPRRLRRLHGRFRAMVIPGTEISVEHARRGAGPVLFAVRNHEGELAIAQGLAEVS